MRRTLYLGLLALAVVGCGGTDPVIDDDDPASALADRDEEWFDEGPPDGDEGIYGEDDESALGTSADALTGPPKFQMPFPCNQVWAGQTRTNHSPQLAIDLNRTNDFGDPVVASARGTVTRVANEGNTSYGRWIEIGHGNGYRTRYAHLSKQIVSVGQKVKKGQRIGRVGNSGGSFGAHLHYEQRHNGTPIKIRFNGNQVLYYGTRNYKSRNCN